MHCRSNSSYNAVSWAASWLRLKERSMCSRIRYTYQDYLTIPEDTSRHYEIVDGESGHDFDIRLDELFRS